MIANGLMPFGVAARTQLGQPALLGMGGWLANEIGMVGINVDALPEKERMAQRGW